MSNVPTIIPSLVYLTQYQANKLYVTKGNLTSILSSYILTGSSASLGSLNVSGALTTTHNTLDDGSGNATIANNFNTKFGIQSGTAQSVNGTINIYNATNTYYYALTPSQSASGSLGMILPQAAASFTSAPLTATLVSGINTYTGFSNFNLVYSGQLSAAQIQTFYTTPVLLIAAPGAGLGIFINSIYIEATTGLFFSGVSSANIAVQYGNTAQGAGPPASGTLASNILFSGGQYYIETSSSLAQTYGTIHPNAAIYLSYTGSNLTGGGPINVVVHYDIITV